MVSYMVILRVVTRKGALRVTTWVRLSSLQSDRFNARLYSTTAVPVGKYVAASHLLPIYDITYCVRKHVSSEASRDLPSTPQYFRGKVP